MRVGGHGVPLELVCCAPADTAIVALKTRVTLAVHHRARWGRSIVVILCILSSGLPPSWCPRGLVNGGGAPPSSARGCDRVSAPARRCSSRARHGGAMR